MKTTLTKLTLGVSLLFALTSFSQENKIQPCNTFAVMEEEFAKDPEARKRYEAIRENFYKDYLEAEKNLHLSKSATVQYTVPVVFHVLHQGGPENISDAQCISALNQMNSDYAAAGSDFSTIFAPFQALYVNSDIKFMLAHKDPNGNCTSGITHEYNAKTNWNQTSANSASYYSGITWDPTKYLNIIIVNAIAPGTATAGVTIVGYTHIPGQYGSGDLRDAVVYNRNFLTGLDARSLTHEAGHWLGLYHTFGNTNNPGVVCGSTAGGDYVSDTPDTKGNFSTCPASSTNTAFTCTSPNPTNSANYYQNVENIMDYSSCPKNFTQGQTTLIRTTLASGPAGRTNISSSGNIIFTDVNAVVPCAPIADYFSTSFNYSVCSGGSLTMKDFSYNGVISSYSWTADNGAVITNSTASITAMSFPNQGIVNVTLTVSNAQGSSSKIRQVTVLNGTPFITGNYFESFENPGVPTNWSVVNLSNLSWTQTYAAAKDGLGSYYVDASSSSPGQQVILQMPIMDVLNNPSNLLTFSYAYARKTATQNDQLLLQGSLDCGGTWGDIITNLNGAAMQANSGGVSAVPFIPTLSQWKNVTVNNYPNWFNYFNSSHVILRFLFKEDPTTGGGNNLYLDAVNFSNGINGINELTKSYQLNLSPNPSNGEATLKFNLNDAATVNVNVVDVLGKTILPATTYNYNAGEQSISINKNNNLSKGIYFVNVSINGAKMSRKLIID